MFSGVELSSTFERLTYVYFPSHCLLTALMIPKDKKKNPLVGLTG